ncbi:MAG: hypothetical protein IJC83_06495 [Oscillospiraceae bacterium]|nr:hypothetical protein [Oscillospiraceae bacterium]
MALFCSKCGKRFEGEGELCEFCATSGTPTQQVEPTVSEPVVVETSVVAEPTVSEPVVTSQPQQVSTQGFTQTNQTTSTSGDFEINNDKLMGILSYISILVVFPIFVSNSKAVKHHTNQGLVLAIIEIAWWIVSAILSALLDIFLPNILMKIVSIIFFIPNLAFIVLSLWGIYNVVKQNPAKLPIIGDFTILK